MSTVLPVGRPGVQVDMPDEQQHRRQMARAINRIMQGHINSTLTVTLDPNVTQTVVTDARISPQSCVSFQPQTAHAAAALTGIYAVCGGGTVTINHANSAQTDRTFTMGIVG